MGFKLFSQKVQDKPFIFWTFDGVNYVVQDPETMKYVRGEIPRELINKLLEQLKSEEPDLAPVVVGKRKSSR